MNMINNSFFMQSEVCGDIRLGRLDNNQIQLLINSIKRKILDNDLEELFSSIHNMPRNAELFGLSNTGNEGETGNQGRIIFEHELSLSNVINKCNTQKQDLIDGVYILSLALGPQKLQFNFPADFHYESSKLEEVSVPINLPKEIKHSIHGELNFNIIHDFNYEGQRLEIEDYDENAEIIDICGLDVDQIFFIVKDAKTSIVYHFPYELSEWSNDPKTIEIMETMK